MKGTGIISRAEAFRILRNDLRKAALEKRAGELASADAQARESILAEIDRQIDAEVCRRAREFGHEDVFY